METRRVSGTFLLFDEVPNNFSFVFLEGVLLSLFFFGKFHYREGSILHSSINLVYNEVVPVSTSSPGTGSEKGRDRPRTAGVKVEMT